MPIDWFTVAAQAINFLILVWLLKRFLYQPILNAIDEREKGIAAQLAAAEAKQADAQKVRDDFQQKTKNFDLERAALMTKAAVEAGVERQRLLDEAKLAADSLRTKRQESLRNEQRELSQKISRWTQHEVFAITRKTLADLASASLEERMVDLFVIRVRTMSGDVKEQLTKATKISTQPPRTFGFRSATAAARRDRKLDQGDAGHGGSSPVRDRSRFGRRNRTVDERTEGGMEHRELSFDAGKEC